MLNKESYIVESNKILRKSNYYFYFSTYSFRKEKGVSVRVHNMPLGKKPLTIPRMEETKPASTPVTPQKSIRWNITQPRHSMEHLILDKATHTQILDVVSYFQNRDLLFSQWGLGEHFASYDLLAVNLYGPPGTGKTVAAHSIAAALHLPMICVDYAEIESKYVGETSKNLSNLFQTASEQNAVIFFDEADALLSKRVTNMTSATDVSESNPLSSIEFAEWISWSNSLCNEFYSEF